MNPALDRQYLGVAHFDARLILEPGDDGALSNILVEYEKRWPSRRIDLFGPQEVGTKTELHHLIMELENEKQIGVHMDYHLLETSRIGAKGRAQRRRDINAVHRILSFLESRSIESHFRCDVDWEFPTSGFSTLVSLPLMRLNTPGGHFDKISGVRLSGVTPNQNVILDQTLDESATTVDSYFTLHNLWSREIFQRILQESESLIEDLIFEEPQESTNEPQD